MSTDAFDLFENHADIGAVQLPGSCEYDPEQQIYTIASAGVNHDNCHFVWKRLSGSFIVTMQAKFIGIEVNSQAKLGWMVRTNPHPSSPDLCARVNGEGDVSLEFRRTLGGLTEEVKIPVSGADVIQIERRGATYIISVARYGEPFTMTQISDLDLGEVVYVGLFLCSHEEGIIEKAVFRNVRIVVSVKAGFDRGKDPFGNRLEILDVANGHRQIVYSSDNVFEAPNWTRDGKSLIFNSDGRLYRFDLEKKVAVLLDTGNVIRNNNDHVISFDGNMLAISSHTEKDDHSMIYTVPLIGGTPKQITPTGPSYLHGWSPDGKFLVYTGLRNGSYDIYRIPAEGGDEIQLTSTPGFDDGPEYTPDGRYIYFNSVRIGRMQIWRMKPDGGEPEQVTDDEYNNWFPHISPDGKWILFLTYLVGEVEPSDHPAAKRVYLRIMPLEGGVPKVLAYLYGGQGTLNVPSWSPDGKMIAFVSNTAL